MIAPVIVAIVVPVVAATIAIMPVTMMLPVARGVFVGVPMVLHEVDPFAAGLVLAAVLAPVLGVAGRDAQVDGWAVHRYALDEGRLRIEEYRRRVAANVDPAIKPGLADADRYANIGGECRGTQGGAQQRQRNQYPFHVFVSFVGPLLQLNQRAEAGFEDVAIATSCKYM